MKKIIKAFVVVFVVVFAINFFYNIFSPAKIAVVNIYGIITPNTAKTICEQLNEAQKDPTYKAILLKIDSPGGDATQSEKIYYLVKKIDQKKPVVALIESVGASGAYFASLGARKIVTYPASLTGSIGVIFEGINVYKLANKIGIEEFVVKSGKVKDAGNPLRKPTKADKEMLFSVVESVYNQFLQSVSTSRHISIKQLKPLADGRVFTGQMALNYHLIDSIGGFDAAKAYLKDYTGIKSLKFVDLSDDNMSVSKLFGLSNIERLLDLSKTPSLQMIFK
ncbi:signal peptide peptidase SppA, 36K type [Desulfurella amilsii]|uniref:Signal peptide peptidase SppA, 36K type n=1 Tax=Desulfurella amilsii TaxID=1562698 RepID=A0A1X4XWA1_9BACT|nr:signal peptide peptidase SppA [Desulfurella amilsii]OSS41810.1 signal peptide peptidase SppA, 36K type [Desulfurella amilsii]